MSATLQNLLNEFFFGSGFWLGFLIISAFAIGLSYKFKFSGVIFELVLFFFALEYLENIAVDSSYMWGAILCFVEMILISVKLYSDVH